MELKIAGITRFPWSIVFSREINGKNVTILDQESLLGMILNTLSQRLHFNYTMSFASSSGTKDPTADNLTFNGIVGMLQKDQIDLALGPLVIDRGDRYLVADPSVIVIEDAFSILSSGQNIAYKNTLSVLSLTKSFQTNVWYLIFFTLLLIILIFSFDNHYWKRKSKKTSPLDKKGFMNILIRNIFEYSGNLFRQYNLKSNRNPQILKLCWKISSFLLVLFYSSMLLANLIASNKKYIETFEDLANANVMTTTYINSSIELQIRERKTKAFNRIYSRMVKHGLHNCLLQYKQLFSDEIMVDILLGKRALIAQLYGFKSFLSSRVKQKGHCGFYLAETLVENVPKFMLFNKKFNKKFKDEINSILLDIFERKPFNWKIEKYYHGYKICLNDQTSSYWKPVILLNIHGLLLVCMILITLAFVVLFIEKINNSF